MALAQAVSRTRTVGAGRELLAEGEEVSAPQLLVSGWCARVRLLSDGRRQILTLLLPGDLIGLRKQPLPATRSAVIALTAVTACVAPDRQRSPSLGAAYGQNEALAEKYLLAQIVRLGQLTAQERLGDLLLELNERLAQAGLASERSFVLPLTQLMLADMLGMTGVHVNRVIQLTRQSRAVTWRGRRVTLSEPSSLGGKARHVSVQGLSAEKLLGA